MTGRSDAFARADAALRKVWDDEAAEAALPYERYKITFTSGWTGCSQVMSAMGPYEGKLRDAEWTHDPPHHAFTFSAQWPVLKSMQAAMKCALVRDLRCTRM